jgi:anti-sigma regulatory factor (Ser/Thr protein kinase)
MSLREPVGGPATIALEPDIEAPGRARRFAIDAAGSALGDRGLDALRILVSEVVANVVVHARTRMQVNAHVTQGCVRIEVTDDLPPDPDVRPGSGESYGLRLVDALAARWGVDARPNGKTVWFEVIDLG